MHDGGRPSAEKSKASKGQASLFDDSEDVVHLATKTKSMQASLFDDDDDDEIPRPSKSKAPIDASVPSGNVVATTGPPATVRTPVHDPLFDDDASVLRPGAQAPSLPAGNQRSVKPPWVALASKGLFDDEYDSLLAPATVRASSSLFGEGSTGKAKPGKTAAALFDDDDDVVTAISAPRRSPLGHVAASPTAEPPRGKGVGLLAAVAPPGPQSVPSRASDDVRGGSNTRSVTASAATDSSAPSSSTTSSADPLSALLGKASQPQPQTQQPQKPLQPEGPKPPHQPQPPPQPQQTQQQKPQQPQLPQQLPQQPQQNSSEPAPRHVSKPSSISALFGEEALRATATSKLPAISDALFEDDDAPANTGATATGLSGPSASRPPASSAAKVRSSLFGDEFALLSAAGARSTLFDEKPPPRPQPTAAANSLFGDGRSALPARPLVQASEETQQARAPTPFRPERQRSEPQAKETSSLFGGEGARQQIASIFDDDDGFGTDGRSSLSAPLASQNRQAKGSEANADSPLEREPQRNVVAEANAGLRTGQALENGRSGAAAGFASGVHGQIQQGSVAGAGAAFPRVVGEGGGGAVPSDVGAAAPLSATVQGRLAALRQGVSSTRSSDSSGDGGDILDAAAAPSAAAPPVEAAPSAEPALATVSASSTSVTSVLAASTVASGETSPAAAMAATAASAVASTAAGRLAAMRSKLNRPTGEDSSASEAEDVETRQSKLPAPPVLATVLAGSGSLFGNSSTSSTAGPPKDSGFFSTSEVKFRPTLQATSTPGLGRLASATGNDSGSEEDGGWEASSSKPKAASQQLVAQPVLQPVPQLQPQQLPQPSSPPPFQRNVEAPAAMPTSTAREPLPSVPARPVESAPSEPERKSLFGGGTAGPTSRVARSIFDDDDDFLPQLEAKPLGSLDALLASSSSKATGAHNAASSKAATTERRATAVVPAVSSAKAVPFDPLRALASRAQGGDGDGDGDSKAVPAAKPPGSHDPLGGLLLKPPL
ncbi:unnamed protein product [Polarella glacialis]|uniref:Uncharacterized protein n=1 Tax=Polarella glacialis TaxID=89957 RepID=A0A813FEZ0_POLGL|nr:unnamed protein product [Polarella glacialis]